MSYVVANWWRAGVVHAAKYDARVQLLKENRQYVDFGGKILEIDKHNLPNRYNRSTLNNLGFAKRR